MTHSLVWKQTHVINELQFDLSYSNSDRLAGSVSHTTRAWSLWLSLAAVNHSVLYRYSHAHTLMLSSLCWAIQLTCIMHLETKNLLCSPEWSFIYRGLFTQIGDALSLSQVRLIHCLDLSGSGEGEQRISPLVMRILLHLWLHSFILCTRGQFVPTSQHPLCVHHIYAAVFPLCEQVILNEDCTSRGPQLSALAREENTCCLVQWGYYCSLFALSLLLLSLPHSVFFLYFSFSRSVIVCYIVCLDDA